MGGSREPPAAVVGFGRQEHHRDQVDFAFKRTSLIPDEVRGTWRNPCEGFVGQRKKDKRTKLRKPFKPEHIPVIFDPAGYGRAIKRSAARFWFPLLLHYTGARLTEIAQVTLNDVHLEDEIVWLGIHEDSDHAVPGASKSVKNDASERSVPLHEDLFRIGFNEYVAGLRAADHARLVPELPTKSARSGHPTSLSGSVGIGRGAGFRANTFCTRSATPFSR